MNYFTLEELCRSNTASRLNLNNKPDKLVQSNLKRLINVLNKLRESWGKPIYVTSGYRCPELNKKVGGANTSAHLTGNAVDLVSEPFDEFKSWIYKEIDKYDFDQLILEKNKTSEWVHLGLFNNNNQQRKQKWSITI